MVWFPIILFPLKFDTGKTIPQKQMHLYYMV